MKGSKLLLGLLATSVFTAASAATQCTLLGEMCYFDKQDGVSYFQLTEPYKGKYACALSTASADQKAEAAVYAGAAAMFKPTKIEAGSPIVLDVAENKNPTNSSAQIKFDLKQGSGYSTEDIGVQCVQLDS